MKIQRAYVDTSVVGGCLDREFALESRALMELAKGGELRFVVSDLLVAELRRAPAAVQSDFDSLPEKYLELVAVSPETERLRDLYLADGIVGPGSKNDAHHVAVATVARVDVIVSWNFKHIVHLDKIRRSNAVNMREGYPVVEIRSPREIA